MNRRLRPGKSSAATIVPVVLSAGVLFFATSAAAGEAMPQLEADTREVTLERAEEQSHQRNLTRDREARAIARDHSRAMYRADTLAHELHGTGPAERLARHHRTLFGLAAENVAVQKRWPEAADVAGRMVEGWMNSPGHRANILAPYDVFEVGCYGTASVAYCTQLFVRSTTRLASAVSFAQRPGSVLRVKVQSTASGAGRRISVAPPDAEPSGTGVALDESGARLTLPNEPGLYQIRLWTPQPADATRFTIVPGPVVCVTMSDAKAASEPSCPK